MFPKSETREPSQKHGHGCLKAYREREREKRNLVEEILGLDMDDELNS